MNAKNYYLSLLSMLLLSSCGETVTTTHNGIPSSAGLCTPSASTLKLADAVNYNGTIAAILTKNCTSCHATGKTAPDLSSFALAKASATASLADIQASKMPIGTPLSAADSASFAAWVNGGTLESAAAATTTTATNAAGTVATVATSSATSTICPTSATSNTAGSTGANATAAGSAAPGTTPAGDSAAAGTSAAGAAANTAGTGAATNAAGTAAAANASGTTAAAAQLTYTTTIKAMVASKCLGCHNTGQNQPVMNDYASTAAAAAAAYADMNSKKMPPTGATPLGATDLASFKAWIDAKTPQ